MFVRESKSTSSALPLRHRQRRPHRRCHGSCASAMRSATRNRRSLVAMCLLAVFISSFGDLRGPTERQLHLGPWRRLAHSTRFFVWSARVFCTTPKERERSRGPHPRVSLLSQNLRTSRLQRFHFSYGVLDHSGWWEWAPLVVERSESESTSEPGLVDAFERPETRR